MGLSARLIQVQRLGLEENSGPQLLELERPNLNKAALQPALFTEIFESFSSELMIV